MHSQSSDPMQYFILHRNANSSISENEVTAQHFLRVQAMIGCDDSNERSRRVEADIAMCPLPSLFCREENRDGVAYLPYTLHSYWSIATPFIADCEIMECERHVTLQARSSYTQNNPLWTNTFRTDLLCRGFQDSELQSLLTVPSMLPFQPTASKCFEVESKLSTLG